MATLQELNRTWENQSKSCGEIIEEQIKEIADLKAKLAAVEQEHFNKIKVLREDLEEWVYQAKMNGQLLIEERAKLAAAEAKE